MSSKIPLILFSGGLDSTWLMLDHARHDRRVNVVYLTGGQRPTKQECEKAARTNIIDYLHANYKEFYATTAGPVSSQVLTNNDTFTFCQFLPWFIHALEVADASKHSCVEIGYVMGDQIVQHLDGMAKAWEALWPICKRGDVVPLTFPLRDTGKAAIIRDMPGELYRMTWVCELPEGDVLSGYKPCGTRCEACITRGLEEHRYWLKNGETLTDSHDRQIRVNKQAAEESRQRELKEAERLETQEATDKMLGGDRKRELLIHGPGERHCHEIDGPSDSDLKVLDDYGQGRHDSTAQGEA